MPRLGPRIAWLPLALLATLVLWLIISPMFAAQFGVIDDHEIAAMLGPARHLDLAEFVPTLAVWLESDTARFRPFRWVLRVLEAVAWGWNPAGWYLDRLLLAGATVVATTLLGARFVARPIAVLAGLLVFVGLQSEAWYRLGPQEAYATLLLMAGLGCIAYGRIPGGLTLIVLAALTKETFVPVAALGIAWVWHLGHRRSASIGGVAVLAVAAGVAVTALTNGEPFAQTRSVLTVGSELKWMLVQSALVTLWPAFALILVIVDRRRALIVACLAAAIIVPQAVLDAELRGGRYLLPTALGAILVTTAGLAAVISRWPRLGLLATYVVALVAMPSAIMQAEEAGRQAAETRAFQSGVAAVEKALDAQPGAVLVVRPTDVWDFEPLVAFRVYVPRGTAMFIPPPQLTDPPAFAVVLHETMVDASARGGLRYSAWRQPSSCVEAVFHERLSPPVCETSIVLTGWQSR
jgi:hypothetical protein